MSNLEIAIGVVSHVKREEMAAELSKQLSPEMVAPDDGTLGAGMNHYTVLQRLREKYPSRWLVILEDDAKPVQGLREQLAMALPTAPSKIVSLYLGTGYPAQYQRLFSEAIGQHPDTCWLLHAQLRHGVGYCIHPEIARALLIRMEKLIRQHYAPDDAISWWAQRNREVVSYTNPSLVDHADGPTVIDYRMHLGHVSAPGRKRPRVAHKVGTRETWDGSCVTVAPL
jgi:hypothetical protein